MAIITYEGFENYSSIASVQTYLNYERTTSGGTIELISTADANGITGRNGGTCLKLTNTVPCGGPVDNIIKPVYPRVFLKNPNNATLSSGIFGFAWYARLPSGGGWGNFTPIAVLCDTSGKPHFFIGINSNLNIEIRSYTTGLTLGNGNSSSGTYWDAQFINRVDIDDIDYYDYNAARGCGDIVSHSFSSNHNQMLSIINLGGTLQSGGTLAPLLGTSSNLITMNAWNYIEVKFVLSTTNTGSIQLKINKNASDANLDINVSSIRTTYQNNTNAIGVALGQWWGHNSANTSALHTANLWNMYYDDYYILDLTGANNNFLGRVSCKKFSYNNVVNYTMTTPANSGTALTNFNETYSGIGTLSTTNVGNVVGQTLDVKSTGVSSETFSPIFVRQYVHGYKTDANSDVGIGATDGVNTISSTNVNFNNNSINGTLKFRDYDNAPDGAEWTNQKIADTIFKHTITVAS